ncbi:MAG: UbiA family prenyltransferase [Nanoarchaeota archaeon]
MNPYIEILRPSVCLMTLLGIVIGSVVAGVLTSPILIVLAVIASVLITGAGNALNDYYDIETDKINAPKRVLPSGRMKPKNVPPYTFLLYSFGIVISFIISYWFLFLAILNVFISTAYAMKLKKTPLVGSIGVSWLGASAFLAPSLFFNPAIILEVLLLSSIAFFGSLSREVLKAIRDVEGDKKIGAKTLPIVIGEKKSFALAAVFLLIGCVLLAVPFLLSLFNVFYLIGAVPAILLCLYALTQKAPKAQKLVKIAIYLVFLGFMLGSI